MGILKPNFLGFGIGIFSSNPASATVPCPNCPANGVLHNLADAFRLEQQSSFELAGAGMHGTVLLDTGFSVPTVLMMSRPGKFKHKIPAAGRPRRSAPRKPPHGGNGGMKGYLKRPVRVGELNSELSRYVLSLAILTPADVKNRGELLRRSKAEKLLKRMGGGTLDRSTAEELMMVPDNIKALVDYCFDFNHPDMEFKPAYQTFIRALVMETYPFDAVFADEVQMPDRSSIWKTWASEVQAFKLSLKNRLVALQRLTDMLSETAKKMDGLEKSLDGSAFDETQMRDLKGEFSKLLSDLKAFLAHISSLCLGNMNAPSKLDPIVVNRELRKSSEELSASIGKLNEAVETFNDAAIRHASYLKCPGCMTRKHIRGYYKDFGFVEKIPIIRSFVRGYHYLRHRLKIPSIRRIMRDEKASARRAHDVRYEEAAGKSEKFLETKARMEVWNEQRESIGRLNAMVGKMDVSAGEFNRAAEVVKKAIAELQNPTSGFSARRSGIDERDPEAQIAAIEQAEAFAGHYRGIFASMSGGLGGIASDLTPLMGHLERLISISDAIEDVIGESSDEKFENKAIGLDLAFNDRVTAIERKMEAIDGHFGRFVARQRDSDLRLDDLALLVGAFGGGEEGRVLSSARRVQEIRAELAAEALRPARKTEELKGLLRSLQKHRAYSGMDGGDNGLTARMLSMQTDDAGGFKTAILTYMAGEDYGTELERKLYRDLLDRYIANEGGAMRVEGLASSLSQHEFLERAVPGITDALTIIRHIASRRLFRLQDHAFKHAGASIGGCVYDDQSTPILRREILWWGDLREGDSPYSERALNPSGHDDQILAHYLATTIALAENAPAFIAIYDERPGALEPLPCLCFVKDLSEYGFPGKLLFTTFDFTFGHGVSQWKTTYITTYDKLMSRGTIAHMIPVPRSILGD